MRVLHNKQINKLQELEAVRRSFKHSRYDDVRSGFGNKELLASALKQFVQGVVSGSELWRTIQRNQRYRNVGAAPDFGSGGLGNPGNRQGSRRPRAHRQSSWNWPQPRRGGGNFRIPGMGEGGFKTGGGF